MKTRTLLLIAASLTVATCSGVAIDLTRDAGIGLEGPDGVQFRYRPGSWVVGLTGAQCTTIGATIHCRAEPAPTAYLLAHEWRHVEQQRGEFVPWWLTRYWLGAADSLEPDAHRFGCLHQSDAYWRSRAAVVARIRVNALASPAELVTCKGVS